MTRHLAAGASLQVPATNLPGHVVNDVYTRFYIQPATSGTAGNTYTYTVSLPRTVAAGEGVVIIPVGANYGVPLLSSNTTTQFTFQLSCVLTTSIMTSVWTAIYYNL